MSPALSWAAFLVCIAIGAVVYVVVAGGGRYRRMERDALWHAGWDDPKRSAPSLRVYGGVYDLEARGDFDWTFDHDPLTDDCKVCSGRRRRAFNRLADRPGSPRDADELMAALLEELDDV
jgi:hypothetical protein